MSSPNPNPQNLQILDPAQPAPVPQQVPVQQAVPQQAAQQPAPLQHPVAPPDTDARGSTAALEDRMLTTEETTALLRGEPPKPPEVVSNADDPAQAQQVQDWMRTTQPDPTQQPQPTPQPQPIPPQQIQPQPFTPEQIAQMASQGVQPTPVPPGQPVPGQPVPAAAQPQLSPSEAALQAQNQLLQQQVSVLTTQMQQRPQVQQHPGQPQQQQQPAFNFEVPDQYLNALSSEDAGTRRTALNSMLNAVGEAVMARATQTMGAYAETIPQLIQSQTQGMIQAQDVQRDMYGTYPELEPYREFVKAAATQIAGSAGISGWNQDVRDAIAERVAPMVPGLFQRIQAHRASRIAPGQQQQMLPAGYPQPQQMVPTAQPLPQGQWSQPPGSSGMLPPAVGGTHGAPASPQPVYVRDASGNLVPAQVPPRPFHGGAYSRPEAETVDPQLADIWQTLGFR